MCLREKSILLTFESAILLWTHTTINPKRIRPPRHFLLYLSRFKTIFFKTRTQGYDAALRNRALGPTKNWPKTDFQWKLHTNRVFFFFVFVFRIHFHYVLSYFFGLFGVRTCVSILWHTSLPKNAILLEKIAKTLRKTMILAIFGDFCVFDMTSLMTSLWRHTRYVCTFLVPMDS